MKIDTLFPFILRSLLYIIKLEDERLETQITLKNASQTKNERIIHSVMKKVGEHTSSQYGKCKKISFHNCTLILILARKLSVGGSARFITSDPRLLYSVLLAIVMHFEDLISFRYTFLALPLSCLSSRTILIEIRMWQFPYQLSRPENRNSYRFVNMIYSRATICGKIKCSRYIASV